MWSLTRSSFFILAQEARNGGEPVVGWRAADGLAEEAAVLKHQCFGARIESGFHGDEAAAAVAGKCDERGVNFSVVWAALVLIFREDPIERGDHFFRCGSLVVSRRRRGALSGIGGRRGCFGSALDFAGSDGDIAVAGDLNQMEARAGGVVSATAVAPDVDAEFALYLGQIGGLVHHVFHAVWRHGVGGWVGTVAFCVREFSELAEHGCARSGFAGEG